MEVCVVLVETVVGQMDVLLLPQVSIARLVVLLSGKAGQAVLVNVDSEWIDGGQGDIDPQVKLVAVDQQGLANVLTHDHLCALRNLIDVLSDEDAFALRRCRWLADPGHFWLRDHRLLQLNHLVWQNERFGKKFEMSLA